MKKSKHHLSRNISRNISFELMKHATFTCNYFFILLRFAYKQNLSKAKCFCRRQNGFHFLALTDGVTFSYVGRRPTHVPLSIVIQGPWCSCVYLQYFQTIIIYYHHLLSSNICHRIEINKNTEPTKIVNQNSCRCRSLMFIIMIVRDVPNFL